VTNHQSNRKSSDTIVELRRSLWLCPKCQRPFANTNQSHSCGKYSVDDFLSGKNDYAAALFNRFLEMVNSCGPVILAPAKTRVGFQVRMIFAAVNKLSDRGMNAHVVLARRFEHPRFTKVESFSPRNHANHFKIQTLEELDDEVMPWLRDSCLVGCQEHLKNR
jgi:hypothetical protein